MNIATALACIAAASMPFMLWRIVKKEKPLSDMTQAELDFELEMRIW
jgi:hypothetical protein